MKAIGIQNCVLETPDMDLIRQINEKRNNKYSEEFILKKLNEGIRTFREHGVEYDKIIEIYHKALKIWEFSKDNLDLKLSVFEYLGIQERYLTHPTDLVQGAKLTYSRGMFLKNKEGMVLVNDLFQKRFTFEKKYGPGIDDIVLSNYPFTPEIQEEIRNCRK